MFHLGACVALVKLTSVTENRWEGDILIVFKTFKPTYMKRFFMFICVTHKRGKVPKLRISKFRKLK